jgi:hypothetical protein
VKTVEAHKANGMRKMGFESRVDVVRHAVESGWLDFELGYDHELFSGALRSVE